MAMVKVVSPSGWDFDAPSAQLLKVSSRGVVGVDRGAFIKRAGDAGHVFLRRLGEVKLASGDVPIHVISHGAREFWGPNRNGDGFREATCRNFCHTFEKFARHYRNHKNKDPEQSYGFPKLAAYNEGMHRVELLTILNATKEAAARNGGYVADRELEKLARGEDLATSMACRVPYDVCSWCQKQARTREEYCTESTCGAGGCASNLASLVKVGNDLHHLHVDNPFPCWFDSSTVFRPADRTAYGTRADYLLKAASAGGFFGNDGAKTAEDMGIAAPLGVVLYQQPLTGEWTPRLAARIKVAAGMAALERNGELALPAETRRAFMPAVQPPFDFAAFDVDTPEKVASALGALALNRIILPLRDFARLSQRGHLAKEASAALPGVYSRMLDDGSLERRLRDNRYDPDATAASAAHRHEAACRYSTYSLDKEAVDRRCLLSAIRHEAPPLESAFEADGGNVRHAAEELARDYACYKAAALGEIAAFDDAFLLTARLATSQNQVI